MVNERKKGGKIGRTGTDILRRRSNTGFLLAKIQHKESATEARI
jgi:hypothetical protein